ncbi:MAG: metallophosphoesterase, partial [Myxococcota bacterium]
RVARPCHAGPPQPQHASAVLRLDVVVEAVAGAGGADVVAITGDLIDGYVDRLEDEVAQVRELKSRHGVFYVSGNHEYYWDGPAWLEAAKPKFGMNALVNQHEILRHGDALLVMGGVTDYSAERVVPEHASDPKKAAAGAPEGAFKVLLAHQPKSVYAGAEAGFDLQLSGHTHGGQFYPWNILVGMAHPFLKGLHRFEEKMWVYVSSGTGYWGPPLRLGAPSEITLLTLRRV